MFRKQYKYFRFLRAAYDLKDIFIKKNKIFIQQFVLDFEIVPLMMLLVE